MAMPKIRLSSVFAILVVSFALQAECQKTFRNPIIDGNSADPGVLRVGDHYYLTLSTNKETQITIYKSSRLTDFRNASETKIAYEAGEGQSDMWASEMHIVDGELYIYFTMKVHHIVHDHRMHVIKADDPTNPMGGWGQPILLMPDFEPGIDGTVMKHNGQNYFAWASTWGIWLARMNNATSIGESKLRLRLPVQTSSWECDIFGGCLCEGPYFIYHPYKNVTYLVFSASSTFLPDYVMGIMSIPTNRDPMSPSNWDYGPDAPVVWRNDEEQVYTTGHATFTVSPDGTETWMVYHATDSEVVDGNRVARIEKITWDDNGPIFPRPHGFNTDQPVPSGQI